MEKKENKSIETQQMRVWIIRNYISTFRSVSSIEDAIKLIRRAIKNDLTNENVHQNAFGLEVYEDNGNGYEWCEWYADEKYDGGKYEGNDIMAIIEEKYEH